MTEPLHTIPQVAKLLGISKTRVYQLVHAGLLKAQKVQGSTYTRYIVFDSALKEFQEGRRP